MSNAAAATPRHSMIGAMWAVGLIATRTQLLYACHKLCIDLIDATDDEANEWWSQEGKLNLAVSQDGSVLWQSMSVITTPDVLWKLTIEMLDNFSPEWFSEGTVLSCVIYKRGVP